MNGMTEQKSMIETGENNSLLYQHRHLQMDALPNAFKNVFAKFVKSKQPPEQVAQITGTSCTFDQHSHMLKIKIDPSDIKNTIDISKKIGKKRYALVLDVSGSMGSKATEMVDVLGQIEEELGKLQGIVEIKVLFFSHVLMEVSVGDIASVKDASGYKGGTDFRAPLNEILSLCRQDQETENVVLFMTDGQSSYGWETVANEINKQKNVKMMAVGYGENVSNRSLETIANEKQNVYSFTGINSSDGLYDLLQTVIGADLNIASYPGVVTTSDGQNHHTCYFPYSTSTNEVGLQGSLYLENHSFEEGMSIFHEVDGISEILNVQCSSEGSNRYDAIIAMKNTLDQILNNNVLTKDEGRILSQLNRQLAGFGAIDRRCEQISNIINSLRSFIETGGELETAKPHLMKLTRFVNSVASGAFVSGRNARTINKAAAKTKEMLQYIEIAHSAVIKTHSIKFPLKQFQGDDILIGSVPGETEQYPVLLVTNTKDGYESPCEFNKFLRRVVTEATQLVQPATLAAPRAIGFVFPSAINQEDLPTTFQDMLDSLVRCKINTIVCVGQESAQELEYSRIMFRLCASVLTLGITTMAPNSVCWNLSSAGMDAAANNKDKPLLVMTTLMSYFNAFKNYLVKQGQYTDSKVLEYFNNTNRFFAISNTQGVIEKVENIWMGLGLLYCLPRSQMKPVLNSVARSVVFECMRQSANAKLKDDPKIYRCLQNEFVSKLYYGNVAYNDADETSEIGNPNSWMWSNDFSLFVKKFKDCGINGFKKILDMKDPNKGSLLNSKIRELVKFQFPYSKSEFKITKDNLLQITSNILSNDRSWGEMAPYWLKPQQILNLFNTMHFIISSDIDHRFGYISPDLCTSISEHTHYYDILDFYNTHEEFITDILYLLSTEGLNSNIRATPFPKCSSNFSSLIPGPANASLIESKRKKQLVSNIIKWSINDNWPLSSIVSFFSFLGGNCDTTIIINSAYELSCKFSDPSVFTTIVTSCIEPVYFEEGSTVRQKIDEILKETLFAHIKDSIIQTLTTHFKKSLPIPSVLCSRNFNRDMANLICVTFEVLQKDMPIGTSTFTSDMLKEARALSQNSKLRKGCGYYVYLFKTIDFVVKKSANGPTLFIDKIGQHLERRKLDIPCKLFGYGSNKTIRVYVWGVSKDLENSDYTCDSRADLLLIKAQLQNIRNHYRNVKIPANTNNPVLCYPYFSYMAQYFDKEIPKLHIKQLDKVVPSTKI